VSRAATTERVTKHGSGDVGHESYDGRSLLYAPALEPLLPPGLTVDTLDNRGRTGFLAVALVQTRRLRPAGWPSSLGSDFFLSGYRIFTRFTTPEGHSLRGLRILRSDTDRVTMAIAGNLLTHYNYRIAQVDFQSMNGELSVKVATPGGEADLSVRANLDDHEPWLPANSCFADEKPPVVSPDRCLTPSTTNPRRIPSLPFVVVADSGVHGLST